ncbi:MAG: toxin-antitoxin system YwqK family antitoxin [Sphingobacterium composti]
MAKNLFILLSFIFFSKIILGQEIRYKEKVNDKFTRFFFDDNYYLVDKNCEFKAIERVAEFDTVNFKFTGEFRDYNRQGRLILHGFYKDGIRNGTFKSYHTNGQLRWESSYLNNKEIGEWKYYYPDGKPMLTLSFDNDDFIFVDYWDTFGKQKIVRGEGQYEMSFPIKGFTEHGYTSYIKKGKITKGKPNGVWTTYFVQNEKNKTYETAFQEIFSDGTQSRFIESEYFDYYFISQDDFYIVPSDFFGRAESFLVHGCSFDEYSSFNNHIVKKFNAYLSEEKLDIDNSIISFKARYSVTNKGIVKSMEIIESPENLSKPAFKTFKDLFESVTYFIPSIQNDKPIQDKIILHGTFLVSNGTSILQHVNVEREIGE